MPGAAPVSSIAPASPVPAAAPLPGPGRQARPVVWAALLVLAGLGQALALAWPWQGTGPLPWPQKGQTLWAVQMLALAVLAGVLRGLWSRAALHLVRAPVRAAACAGGLFAWAWLAGALWWLFISMHTYGGLPALLSALAVLVLALALALLYAIACGLWMLLALGLARRGRTGAMRHVGLFAALWTLAEIARGTLLTGFPWGGVGYAHVDGPLAVWAPWVGVYGVGALAAALAMMLATGLAWALRGSRAAASHEGQRAGGRASVPWRAALILALAWALAAWWTPWLADDAGAGRAPVTVTLLQGNIAQDEKFIPATGVRDALRWYGSQLLHAAHADAHDPTGRMVIAPETAIPLLPHQLPQGYWQAIENGFRAGGAQRAAIVGLPLGDAQLGYANAALALLPGLGTAYRYDKHHLVPLGEFIPPLLRWFVQMMRMPLGDFSRGPARASALHWAGERWGVHICYEDLFTEELAARFADPQQAPSVLVNLSNIAWFGDSTAIDQHLHISRMRARELARPVVRATNTGATAVIDAHGRVTALLPRLVRGALHGQVQGRDRLTPYALWAAHLGLWPLLAGSLALVLLAAFWPLPGLPGPARRRGAGPGTIADAALSATPPEPPPGA